MTLLKDHNVRREKIKLKLLKAVWPVALCSLRHRMDPYKANDIDKLKAFEMTCYGRYDVCCEPAAKMTEAMNLCSTTSAETERQNWLPSCHYQ